ncbi:arsenate reductase [Sphingomonas jinjuensis]|uniref:Arsenate reductase n=1 Tax=Sphingomonas jinjuensis TaxID=535907 RepID=A0A840FAC2_9SPHN|nr:ArsC family reductase [Sphingomonas jinjuensis]MBB4153236.1 arsenate reductase [Sphingomonas jinjuensis]
MTTIYGIKNCDTMKKARQWLADHGVEARFHDYRAHGVDAGRLAGWVDRLGWEALLNRNGTTFRALPDADKQAIDRDKALALMTASPAMIRRPVLEHGDTLEVGFKPDRYAALFG